MPAQALRISWGPRSMLCTTKTITISVLTRQVGTGTQSLYDVPNQTGGTSGVGVTRYSSNGPAVSSTPIFNTSTNSWGYTQPKTYQDPRVLAQVAAMYPQRAAGGPISANTPYWVGERGPELVMPSCWRWRGGHRSFHSNRLAYC